MSVKQPLLMRWTSSGSRSNASSPKKGMRDRDGNFFMENENELTPKNSLITNASKSPPQMPMLSVLSLLNNNNNKEQDDEQQQSDKKQQNDNPPPALPTTLALSTSSLSTKFQQSVSTTENTWRMLFTRL